MTSTTARILAHLSEGKRAETASQVAEALGVSKATAKRHLKKLQSLQLAFPEKADHAVVGKSGWRTGVGKNGRYAEDIWQIEGEGPDLSPEAAQSVLNGDATLEDLGFC